MLVHENYRLHCRLREIMERRNIRVDDIYAKTKVTRQTIANLRGNNFKGVTKSALARICGALGVGVGELLEVLPWDIWLPIRLGHEVTLHYGSRALAEPQPARGNGHDSLLMRQFIGSWDMRACGEIHEHLSRLAPGIQVRFKEHINCAGRGADPDVREAARRVFERGNHIVIGSPIANQFAEEVVCHAYGVPPYTPQKRACFPYGFVWDSRRMLCSSFGWQGQGQEFGIAALPSGRLVAQQIVVREGEGRDCALILVYRVFQEQTLREHGDDDERIIICILGYGGPGTLAAARIAMDPQYAAGLYPAARKQPRMRAVTCKYLRAPGSEMLDNRDVTEVMLIGETRTRLSR